jgi:hypothetical protein
VKVLRQDPRYDVSINIDTERMCGLLGNSLIAESGIAVLQFDDRCDEFIRRTLRTGLARGAGGREQAAIFPIDQRLVES